MQDDVGLRDKDGNDVTAAIESMFVGKANVPKLTTVTLSASKWVGESNPWSQTITANGVVKNSKIDLQPTALQIVELQESDIALITENNEGVVTVYAIGGKPTSDYTMQALITEVVVV